MQIEDGVRFSLQALYSARLRTFLMLLAISIGIASVLILSALGEGARRYISAQFSSLGTHLLIVLPGRSETKGGLPPLFGETPRDLTLQDALALLRSPRIHSVAPLVVGSAPVSRQQLSRETMILGSTAALASIRQLELASGYFLPAADAQRGDAVCVLGHKVKQELFGQRSPLGAWLRIGEWRFRVIGVLAEEGKALSMEMSDVVIIPVASAQNLFNTESLFRILVEAPNREGIANAKQAAIDIIRARHDGEDDITIISQDALLATFDKIFTTLTLAIVGIAAISLAVAGILIMNVMLIAVVQRSAEIGLLKALGAPKRHIIRLFLMEAGLLALCGALLGLLAGYCTVLILRYSFPSFPLQVPLWSPLAAMLMALSAGLVFGVLPARKAAQLEPAITLSRR